MICVRNLTKRFDAFTAVDHINFDVEEGEVFGFIGPNGAGKTTTIRMLATLLEPDEGTAWIGGYSIHHEQNKVRHQIGYMPDYFGVYEGVTVWEYLDFFARAYHLNSKTREQTIEHCLTLTDFTKSKNKLVASLSKGMTQRLCLAKTLLHNPKVLILDEPTSGLDPRARIEFRSLIRALADMKKTIFISSHILTELADFVTHIGIMEHGNIIVTGTPREISSKINEKVIEREKEKVTSSTQGDTVQAPSQVSNPKTQLISTLPVLGLSISLYKGNKLEEAYDLLKSLPDIKGIQIQPPNLEIKYAGSEENIYKLLHYLTQKEIPIVSVQPNVKNLEEIFMTLTKGDVD